MNRLRGLVGIAVALAVTGCVAVNSHTPRPVPTTVQSAATTVGSCAASAAAYDGVVAGSFVTTVGAIRRLEPLHIEPELFTGLLDSYPAVLCYIDGQIPKGPPPLGSGSIPPSFERAVVAVIDGQTDFIIAGYRNNVPVVAPAAASQTSAPPLPPGGISQERAVQLAAEHRVQPSISVGCRGAVHRCERHHQRRACLGSQPARLGDPLRGQRRGGVPAAAAERGQPTMRAAWPEGGDGNPRLLHRGLHHGGRSHRILVAGVRELRTVL
jgi:hypothetical protein